MKARCYHGTPHNVDDDAVQNICTQGIGHEPALTNNFVMAAWHALKHHRVSGTIIVCNTDIDNVEYTFCRSKNDHKKVYKFKHISEKDIIEILDVIRDEHGMAKIRNRYFPDSKSTTSH